MNTQFTNSLAGTNRKYVVGQIKPTGYSSIHIQVGGVFGNRPYGLSTDAQVEKRLIDFINSQSKNVLSLASGTSGYVKVQFDVAGGNSVKVQIVGKGVYANRDYGYATQFESAELADYLRKVTETQTEPVAAPVYAAPMLDNNDDGDWDSDEDDDNAETASNTANELQNLSESLESIAELVATAKEELARLKELVG